LFFNIGNGPRAASSPFKDARVRHALELAVDRKAINDVVGNGNFAPAAQPFPPASPYHSSKFPVPARDVAKAKALLKEAGLTTVKAELAFGNNTTISAIAEMIQAMAAEAGIQLSLRPTEYAALLAEAQRGNFDAALYGWSGRVDPDGNIYSFVTCGGSLNDGHYCNAEVDKLLGAARAVPDEAKRKAIYEQVVAILHKDQENFYLYYQPWLFALSKKVSGFRPHPDGMIRLKGVALAP
jgi:peptide/nickel transport system substrate-binding protein